MEFVAHCRERHWSKMKKDRSDRGVEMWKEIINLELNVLLCRVLIQHHWLPLRCWNVDKNVNKRHIPFLYAAIATAAAAICIVWVRSPNFNNVNKFVCPFFGMGTRSRGKGSCSIKELTEWNQMGVFHTSKNVCNADYNKKKQVVYRPKRMFSMALVLHSFSTLFSSLCPPHSLSHRRASGQKFSNILHSTTGKCEHVIHIVPHSTRSYCSATVWKCSRNSCLRVNYDSTCMRVSVCVCVAHSWPLLISA